MPGAFRAVLFVHVCAGVVGLLAFWLPVFVKKGETLHRRAGRAFFWCTSVVAATGLAMAALLLAVPLEIRPLRTPVDPERAALIAWRIRQAAPFLVYLVLITFVPVYHGTRVLATRRTPARLRTPIHTTLHVLAIAGSIAMLSLGIWFRQPVFLALSPIGFLLGTGGLSFARKPYPTPMAWWYAHMDAMLGGGIAFHTAFLVIGAGRLLNYQLDGAWAAVPWILPTVIGVPAASLWIRHYRRKFNEAPPAAARAAA